VANRSACCASYVLKQVMWGANFIRPDGRLPARRSQ
jgi:hypothetical protein